MALEFLRELKVSIKASSRSIVIDKLYMTFNIHKSVSDEDISPSTIEIYNPDITTINEIQIGNGISVEAGYVRQMGNIFNGAITDKKRDRRSEDRVVVLEMLSTPVISLNSKQRYYYD